jgi:hypothetical protein
MNFEGTYSLQLNSSMLMMVGRSSKLLLILGSTLILGSESCGIHDHILLPHDSR